MKTTLSILVLLGWALVSVAQQAITYMGYQSTPTPLNNAASLVHGGSEVQVTGRRQWVGLEGAPQALWGSGHVMLDKMNATVGLSIHHQDVAVERYSEASAFFAKAVRISETEYLGLSLSVGVSYYNGNFAQLDPTDPAFRDDIRDADFLTGFGIVLYRPDRYYVGLSLPRLALSSLGDGGQGRQYNPSQQYHLTAAAVFALGADFHAKPALLLTYAANMRPQAEVGALFYVKRVFGVGLNLRTYGDMAGMARAHFGGLSIGYGYQFNTRSQIGKRNLENATHEVGIGFRFGKTSNALL